MLLIFKVPRSSAVEAYKFSLILLAARVRLALSGLLSMMYLVFNTQQAPFDDVRVRRALSLAIDQRILTEKVLRSGNEPAYSFVPHLLENYQGVALPHAHSPLSNR